MALSGHHLAIDMVVEQRRDCRAGLRTYFAAPAAHPERFAGLTQAEIDAELFVRLEELDRSQSLVLLAAIEALFRVDFERRCTGRRREPLTRAFRDIRKARTRVRFDEDILETWKASGRIAASVIAQVRAALKLRHWLAHGRYWTPKLGQTYDFDDLVILADALASADVLQA